MSCSGRSGRTAPLGLAGLRVFCSDTAIPWSECRCTQRGCDRALPACAVGP